MWGVSLWPFSRETAKKWPLWPSDSRKWAPRPSLYYHIENPPPPYQDTSLAMHFLCALLLCMCCLCLISTCINCNGICNAHIIWMLILHLAFCMVQYYHSPTTNYISNTEDLSKKVEQRIKAMRGQKMWQHPPIFILRTNSMLKSKPLW
jgi:hypothetical protein